MGFVHKNIGIIIVTVVTAVQ